ncbi:MAG: hypothetical protein H0T59_01705 [Chloroflexi bacterium]|nr:hypothetical protein [Chloroflexota bacterium]
MQIRVVTDQPWDVPADVLAIPMTGEPSFDGPLGELDRRSSGEIQSLVTFGEIRGKRFATAVAAAGEIAADRLLAVGLGDTETIDRETVVRIAAAVQRRLAGRVVRRLAIWITPLADALDGDAAAAAEMVGRGALEGSYDPRTI